MTSCFPDRQPPDNKVAKYTIFTGAGPCHYLEIYPGYSHYLLSP